MNDVDQHKYVMIAPNIYIPIDPSTLGQAAIKALEELGFDVTLNKKKEFVLDFDWSNAPKWANKYISMDESGDWYVYSDYPEANRHTWYKRAGSAATKVPAEFAPKNFTGDWKDSLFKNPNIKE